MPRTLFFIIILLIALGILFLAHFYGYLRLQKTFQLNKIALMSVLFILTAGFILTSIITRKFDSSPIKFLYFIFAVWIGVLFFLVVGFAISDLVISALGLLKITLSAKIVYSLALILVILVSSYSVYNAGNIKVSKISIPSSLENETKIIQISDVHLGAIHSANYLKKIVSLSNSRNPDFIFITGDLLDGGTKVSEEIISSLPGLKAKKGVYFVTGNHETYMSTKQVLNLIKSEHIQVLDNEVKNTRDIQIIGLSYPGETSEKDNPNFKLLNSINKSKFSILLYHPPVGFDKASEAGVNLQLSGHTHDGQIFPINLISRIFYKYVNGFYKINNSYLYVSSGAGTWGPPMRFGSNSEITEIDLKTRL